MKSNRKTSPVFVMPYGGPIVPVEATPGNLRMIAAHYRSIVKLFAVIVFGSLLLTSLLLSMNALGSTLGGLALSVTLTFALVSGAVLVILPFYASRYENMAKTLEKGSR